MIMSPFLDYPNTVEYPGSLLRANQIELQYRDRDIMCLEQFTITEGTYRIDLLQDWDPRAFNIETYRYRTQKPAWKSRTGKKVTLWSNACSPDPKRILTTIEPYEKKCHQHLFIQHDHIKTGKLKNFTFI